MEGPPSPCDEVTACPYAESGCFTDSHHLYWPRNEYQTKTERKFRNLGENVITLCRFKHDLLHLEKPPHKPDFQTMRDTVERNRYGV